MIGVHTSRLRTIVSVLLARFFTLQVSILILRGPPATTSTSPVTFCTTVTGWERGASKATGYEATE